LPADRGGRRPGVRALRRPPHPLPARGRAAAADRERHPGGIRRLVPGSAGGGSRGAARAPDRRDRGAGVLRSRPERGSPRALRLMAAASLPPPDADAQAHSALLRDMIAEQAIAAGGSLPFWKFMELALYAPGLGYYSAGATKFGAAGDFTTAPELSPLYSACVADAFGPVLRQLGPEAVFVEVGGGSGAFAETCLSKLLAEDALPDRYAILEPSADLRERQRERLQQRLPPLLFELVEWLDGPIHEPWNGVLFANEVIDALPTPRFAIRDGEVLEAHVATQGRLGDGSFRFVREERPADPMLAAAVRHVERQLPQPFAEGYRGELLAQLPYWLQAVVGGMGD